MSATSEIVIAARALALVIAACAMPAACTSSKSTAKPPAALPPLDPGMPRHYACQRAAGSITVDGVLDDGAWNAAPWSDTFVDIEGSLRPQPRFETRMKMLWDDRCLYVAARMVEPHVWATYDRRDMIVFHENDFEIFIDPDGDTRDYFEIEINALGTIFDLFLARTYIDGGPADHDWNCPNMRSAVSVDGTLNDPSDVDRAWSVEFALPWSAFEDEARMPCPPRPGDQWRINFSRVQWKTQVIEGAYRKVDGEKEDNWVWSAQGVIDMHRPQRWGFVSFEP